MSQPSLWIYLKAFDCLPHSLLIAKLRAYGLSGSAKSLISSYLHNRKQCVQLGSSASSWVTLLKGVPQGSILGPLLFNIFINDIFHFVKTADLYNYADDNSLSHAENDLVKLQNILESESASLIDWFESNGMQANPKKFQAIAVGPKTHELNLKFNVNNTIIECEDEVKLLGVTADFKLSFDTHVSSICKKNLKAIKCTKAYW